MKQKDNSDIMNDKILDRQIEKELLLAESVRNELGETRSSIKAFAFIIVVLKILYNKKEFKKSELKKIITDGDKDLQFDAIVIGDEYIDIFDISFKEPKSDDMVLLEKSIIDNIENEPEDYSIFNSRLKAALKKIHSVDKNVRLFVVRKGIWKKVGNEKKLKDAIGRISGLFEYLNTESLTNKMLLPQEYFPVWEFKLGKKDIYFFEENEAFLRIPVNKLLELQRDNVKNGLDLFNKNVRVFLNNKKLSAEMKSTIIREFNIFHLYHNGITITTPKKISKMKSGKIEIYEPQVVNGAQTINSLYEEFKNNLKRKELVEARILCKVVYADNELTNKICETSNTQIPIKAWDLRANDDIQIKLEKYIESIPDKNYQYKRKKIKTKKGKVVITLPELTQWIFSAIHREPAYAKDKKSALFDIVSDVGYYHDIKINLEKTEKVEWVCDIGIFVRNKISNASKDERGVLRDMDMHIIAALYFLFVDKDKDFKKADLFFDRVVDILNKHIKDRKTIEEDITNNKIFTKKSMNNISGKKAMVGEAWDFLFGKIKKF